MRLNLRKNWFLIIIYTAVFVVGSMVAYQGWTLHKAKNRVYDTSFNQFQGNPDGKKIIVEFLDYRCHACREVHHAIMELIEADPEVKVIYRHFPLFERQSVIEAEIALAAGQHGKYDQAHEFLISREEPVPEEEIENIARMLGIEPETFAYDMKSYEMGKLLLETLDMTQMLGINSTPTFIIRGNIYTPDKGMPTAKTFQDWLAAEYGE